MAIPPFVLREIADTLEGHESAISHVTNQPIENASDNLQEQITGKKYWITKPRSYRENKDW